jgi:predicted DCC family thiol-disulfide oxidoreductase YuxK
METKNFNKKIILFDGVCNLCNNLINKIIRLDKHDKFLFASLQGKKGKEIIKEFNLQEKNIDSIVIYSDKEIKIKSKAVIDIIYNINPLFRFIIIFRIIPSFILDIIYDFVSKRRYKWYGKKNKCMIPDKNIQSKFIE